MHSARDYAHLVDAKRTAAAEIRRIARTVSVDADRIFLIRHASWLESEAVALETKAAASARDYAHLVDAKRTAAAEIRRIARTISVDADRIFLISHASWLESEAVALETKAAAIGSEHIMRERLSA
jgi:hypothetical protein